MNILIILLRLIHIVAGVFWVGANMFTAFFLSPAVAANGDAGQKLMGYMVTKARISERITIAAVLTVLAGAVLYWNNSGGLHLALDDFCHRLGLRDRGHLCVDRARL